MKPVPIAADGIHLFGASGSGTTTLGRRLADHLAVPHLDSDAYYWVRTMPPFRQKVAPAERLRRLQADLPSSGGWVSSGSLVGWGDALRERFQLAVWLCVDPVLRLSRLQRRERARYGDSIAPGGELHADHLAFLQWALRYDTAGREQRSRALHAEWSRSLPCPVLRLDGALPLSTLLAEVCAALARPDRARSNRAESDSPGIRSP